ncbi:MAG: acyltransferase family protein [Clostridia bacterium]|nr:acyltransferase family protein [Clostridia bacterium]
MNNPRTREVYLDALKTFALLLVFALHTQRGVEVTDPCHNAVFFYAARCGMPLFFMVNGSLILRKKEFTFPYYKKKLLGILRVLCIWGAVTAVYKLAVARVGFFSALKEGVKGALAYTDVVNLWFFYSFILIYTLLLVAFPFIRKHIWKVTAGLGALCALVDAASLISIAGGGFFVQAMVTQRLRLWTWVFYFCLGYALSTVDLGRIKAPLIYAGAAALTAACVALQYHVCWNLTGQMESNYMYDNALIILWCAFVFLAFRKGGRVSAFFARFVGPSFGAFLLHSYFIDAFHLRYIVRGPWQAFLSWALLSAGSWALSWIAGKIPVVREAFRY